MEVFYLSTFGILAALAAGLELTKPTDTTVIKHVDFRRFRNNYLVVYSLMMGANMILSFSGLARFITPSPPPCVRPWKAPRCTMS